MNVSLSWLRAVAPGIEGTAEEVAERLAASGAPVEELTRLGGELAEIRVGRVRDVREHPDADRLVLCDVETGDGEIQVVCGAPNVEPGGLYPLAPVGATLPGGMEIRAAKIRGQASSGMLCSEQELGLGHGSAGLMELPGGLEPGARLVEALGLEDVRMDVEVTANRGDLLSHLGIARELAPAGDAGLRPTPVPGLPEGAGDAEVRKGGEKAGSEAATIRIEDTEGCPRYMAAVVRGVEVGPSPGWLQSRLRAVGSRPINNVVDVTNFVLQEMGHPLHAFDLDRLEDSTIVVRRARKGETLRTLDGQDRTLTTEMLCICDARRPVALAGVMGGEESEVGEGTTDILLECALFEPRRVRSARETLDLSTDASYRFERGVDPAGAEQALRRAVALVLDTAGGRVDGPLLDADPEPWTEPELILRLPRIAEILGVSLPAERVEALLARLGFGVSAGEGEAFRVRVPGWRSHDVTREIDLIEEVARSWGYDSFPEELGAYRPGTVPDHPLFVLEDRLRDRLVGRGFLEAQLPAFAPEEAGEVSLSNPISSEESHLRSSLLPGLVGRVAANFARGARSVRLFELGTCFFSSSEPLPREDARVALVATGTRRPPHWSEEAQRVDVWDAKGWLEELGGLVYGEGATVVPGSEPGSSGGEASPEAGGPRTESQAPSSPFDAAGSFLLLDRQEREVGRAGRVRADRLEAPPWAGPVWALEIALPAGGRDFPTPVIRSPSPFPGVTRDLALVVPDDLPAARVREVVRASGGAHLRSVEIFDLYRGEGIPPGTRSVAFRLHFSSEERTLTDEEVDRAAAAVVDRLEEDLDVRPRT